MSEAKLEAWLEETRSFPPTKEFAAQANAPATMASMPVCRVGFITGANKGL